LPLIVYLLELSPHTYIHMPWRRGLCSGNDRLEREIEFRQGTGV
jgi:hypothetical protein